MTQVAPRLLLAQSGVAFCVHRGDGFPLDQRHLPAGTRSFRVLADPERVPVAVEPDALGRADLGRASSIGSPALAVV